STDVRRARCCQLQSFHSPEASACDQARRAKRGSLSHESSRCAIIAVMLAPVLFSLAVSVSPQDEAPLRLWVSQVGDDSWSGRVRDHAVGNDGPFRTPQHALEEVRRHKREHGGKLDRDAEIVLTEGTHFLDEPL